MDVGKIKEPGHKSAVRVSESKFSITEFIEEILGKIHIKKVYPPICFFFINMIYLPKIAIVASFFYVRQTYQFLLIFC